MRTAKRRFHCLLWSLVGWIGTAALLSAGAVEPPAAPQAGGSGPAITVLEPDEGPVGTEVVIRGENFGASIGVLQGTSGVSFGGVWASPSTWSEGEVRVEVPAGATTGPVVVTVSGVGSEGLAFTVTGAGTTGPAVGTVSPAQGAAGTEVVIRGTDFGPPEGAEQGTAGVSFNGVAGTPASWSEGEIRVAVPEGATAGPVVVTVGGEASNGVGFTVTAAGIARPSIVSVSPELATAGTEVVIRGENFGDPEGAAQGARGVSFNGVWAEPSFWSEGEIRVAVPEGAPGGQVVVVVDGEGSDGAGFTVTGPAPVIETVDPTHGPEGTGVVIRGEHFGSAIAAVQGTAGVSFGGVWAEASFWSGTEIRAAVPEGGESGQVAVTAGGQESNGVDFTVPAGGKGSAWAGAAHASSVGKGEPVGPEITSVTPDSGPVGTSVTVAGTGFGAAQGTSTVSFNGAAGVPTSWSETEIRVPVPAGAATCAPEGTVLTVEVTVGGQKSNGGEFLLDPPVIIEVSDNVVSEPDGEATITVRRDPFQYQTAAYGYRGTAKRGIGKDYVVDRLVFPPGANTATTTLRVLDDQVYEGDETIEIVATVRDLGGKECEISEEILLKDDELPPLAISVITHQHGGLEVSHLREGEPAYRTFAVTVSVPEGEAPATDTTITLVSGGTASSETDYTLAETVTLGVGKRSVETPLTVIDDDPFEIPETLTLQATDGRNDGYQASPVVTVWIYDDNYSTLTVSAEAATVSEPNGTVRVTASVEEGKELATDATVVLGPIGTATHKVDYSLQKRLTLPANQSSVSTVLSVIDDAALEGEETIHLAASGDGTSALGHSQTMTIRLEDDEVPPLTLTADRTSVSEPGGTAQVTVSVPAGGEPSVDTTISIWDIGYARLGEDFTVETLTIPQGGTSGTATLTVIDDDLYEDTEEIRIQASKTGYKISPVLKIQLEDNEQKLRLAVSPGQVSEPSGTAQVTVSVAKAIEADAVVTLHRNGTAASGSDYTLAQTATISAGETSAPATTLQVVDNTIYEGAKTIELQARATGYGDSDPVKVDLADDELPPLTLTVDTASVGEVDGQRRATLTVTVPESAKPAGDLTVTLLHTGAATVATGDYAVETLTIPQEGTSGTATLTVVDDGEYEGDETIVLQATAPDYRASGEVTVTVEDDDPTITGFTPKRGAPDVVVTISGDNFTEQGTTVQFNGVEVEASKVKFVSATEIQATVPPAAATGAITVKTPGGTVTSTDSFTVLRLHIQVDPATVEEKAGKRTAMVTVSVDDPVEGNLPVIFTFQGTADRGRFEDYTMDQTVTITAGNTSAEKTLTVRDDRDYEEEETITIQAGAEGYQSSEVATVALISDDLPELDMSCPLSLQESHGTEQITVYLPFARDADTLVSFAFKGTATRGTDYAMDQMVTIDEGNISAEKTLTVIDDRRHEGDETIDLEASADGYQTAFCVFSIEADANDPVVPPLTLSVSSASLGEASGKRTATVTVSVDDAVEADDGLPVTFTFGGTADRETDPDYTMDQTVTILNTKTSASTTLTVIDDAVAESDETITITAGATDYSDSEAVTVTIADDDVPGVTVSEASLSITEGKSGTYQVKLDTQPTADVTITVASSDEGAVTVTPASLTFTAGNWNTARAVTVEAVHDEDIADETATLTHVAAGGDTNYAGIAIDSVSVSVTDDEVPGVTVTPTRLSITEGSSKSYRVKLKTRPSASVTVSMSSSNGDVGVPSTPLAFTTETGATGGWDQFQSVSVRIAHDDNTTDESGTITHTAASNDSDYDGISVPSVSVSVSDDDPENQQPVVERQIPDMTLEVDEERTINLSPHFSDPDGDNLTYWASSSDTSTVTESVNNATNILTIRGVAVTASSSPTVTVTASDGSLSVSQAFSVTVVQPALSCSVSPAIVSERAGKRTSTIRVTVPAGAELPSSVALGHPRGGTAISDDYTIGALTKRSNAWEATLTVVDDSIVEGNETVLLQASATDYDPSPERKVTIEDDDQPQLGLSVSPAIVSERAGKRTSTIRVTVPAGAELPSSVALGHPRGGTAISDDYTIGALTKRSNAWEATLTVVDDSIVEGNETVLLQASATDYDPSPERKVTIEDDDQPQLGLSVSPAIVSERAGKRTSTIRVTVPAGAELPSSVALGHPRGGTAISDDYTIGALTKRSNAWEATLTVVDDSIVEGNETVLLQASATDYDPSPERKVTIEDDDQPQLGLSVSPAIVSERAGKRTSTIRVTVPAGAELPSSVALGHPRGGTAISDDYTIGALTKRSNAWEATLTVVDDSIVEGNETVLLQASATDYDPSPERKVTIEDDDQPQLGLSVSPAIVSERAGKRTSTIRVTVPAGAELPSSVALGHPRGGTAISDDYTIGALTKRSNAWEATLTVVDDSIVEGNETVLLQASATDYDPSPERKVTIEDDDQPQLGLSVSPAIVSERAGKRTSTIRVTVPAGAELPSSVALGHPRGGTAISDDYTIGALTKRSNAWEATLTVVDDSIVEGNETVLLQASATDYDPSPERKVTIEDDDQPQLGLSVSPAIVSERAGKRTSTIRVTVPAGAELPSSVALGHPRGGTAISDDYTIGALTKRSNAWEATLTVVDDSIVEGNETVLLQASATDYDPSPERKVTIEDDDQPQLGLSVSPAIVSERAGKRTSTIRVTVPAGAELPSSVALGHPRGGTAISDDYTIGALTKRSNAWEATLTVVDDSIVEGNETVLLQASATDYDPSPERKVTIEDDDQPQLGLSVSPAIVSERAGKRTSTIRVTVPAGAELPSSVALGHPRGGTAISDDYTIGALTKRSNAWEATLTVVDDSIVEGNETVLLQASATDYDPSPERKVTIEDDDQPQLGLSVSPAIVSERAGKRTSTIRVTVPAGAELPSSVALGHPRGGTAISDDYTIGALTKRSNAWEATLTVVDDSIVEGNETVLLQASATDYDPSPERKVTIEDDDQPPKPVITSINPALQWLNYPVTIYGNHFGSTPGSVSFGGYTVGSHNFTGSNSGYSWSNASISLLIPGSIYPGHVSVTVTTHNGMTSSPYFYTVTDNPVQRGECDDEEDCPEEKEKEESEGSGETEEDQAEGGG